MPSPASTRRAEPLLLLLLLLLALAGCATPINLPGSPDGGAPMADAGTAADAAATDRGIQMPDTGPVPGDAALSDGTTDAEMGPTEMGPTEMGPTEMGPTEAGTPDATTPDA